MQRLPFNEIYMTLAMSLAGRSHCIKKQVGCVITKNTRIIAASYNGPPKGTYNCDEKWTQEGCPRSLRGGCSLSLHAEQNAILYALKNKVDLTGATLYITLSPCLPCARIIFSVGITTVFYKDLYAAFKGVSMEEGLVFLKTFGIKTMQYNPTLEAQTTK